MENSWNSSTYRPKFVEIAPECVPGQFPVYRKFKSSTLDALRKSDFSARKKRILQGGEDDNELVTRALELAEQGQKRDLAPFLEFENDVIDAFTAKDDSIHGDDVPDTGVWPLPVRDLVVIYLSFENIMAPTKLTAYVANTLLAQARQFQTADLCCLAKSFAAFDVRDQGLWEFLAGEVCHETRKEDWPNWKHWYDLVCAFADVGVAHQKLFGVAATPLRKGVVRVREGVEILNIAKAYAQFGFRHDRLFMQLAYVAPAMSMSDSELNELNAQFARVQFKNDDTDLLLECYGFRTSPDP